MERNLAAVRGVVVLKEERLAPASPLPPGPVPGDDVELLGRFLGGDERAYDALVLRHSAFVLRHARRFVPDDASAEDIAQEVFLRLYRCADRFRTAISFRGWLATMTTRLALNELRTRKRKRWVARSTLEGAGPLPDWRPGADAEDGPSEALMRQERIEAVREALRQLPPRQGLALWLQRFEGWDLQAIGETLELSVPAVKSLLHRARASLADLLEETFRTEIDRPICPREEP